MAGELTDPGSLARACRGVGRFVYTSFSRNLERPCLLRDAKREAEHDTDDPVQKIFAAGDG